MVQEAAIAAHKRAKVYSVGLEMKFFPIMTSSSPMQLYQELRNSDSEVNNLNYPNVLFDFETV